VNYGAGIGWQLHRTAAPGTVVSVPELVNHERIGDTGEEAVIEAMGKAAEEAIENELSAALLTQTWVLRLDQFPSWEIRLPRPPLASVTSVEYVDTNGTTQVLPTTEYVVDVPPANSAWRSTPARLYLGYGKAWPATRCVPNAVTVTYIAGVTKPEDIPERIRIAIRETFGDMYENRERSAVEAVRELELYERLMCNDRCRTEFVYR
jgi:uncharacterized phiE125 gp8 family phage protein